jgi:hypothetical protein
MGYQFLSDDLKGAVSQWFAEQDRYFSFSGISSLPMKWRKCIKLNGDYNEKE